MDDHESLDAIDDRVRSLWMNTSLLYAVGTTCQTI
jgi:hypothetical protein